MISALSSRGSQLDKGRIEIFPAECVRKRKYKPVASRRTPEEGVHLTCYYPAPPTHLVTFRAV